MLRIFGRGETGRVSPDDVSSRSGAEREQDFLGALWQGTKGEAQRVLAGVIEARSVAGDIPGQQDDQVWLELADQRFAHAIEELQRAQTRRQETPDLRAGEIAELQRVKREINLRVRPSQERAA